MPFENLSLVYEVLQLFLQPLYLITDFRYPLRIPLQLIGFVGGVRVGCEPKETSIVTVRRRLYEEHFPEPLQYMLHQTFPVVFDTVQVSELIDGYKVYKARAAQYALVVSQPVQASVHVRRSAVLAQREFPSKIHVTAGAVAFGVVLVIRLVHRLSQVVELHTLQQQRFSGNGSPYIVCLYAE